MYEHFYGLSGLPFSLLPDADFLFYSRRHRRAANLLDYGIFTRAGFVVITGDVGAGKTTILRRYIKHADPEVVVGLITNPSPTLGHLFTWIANTFDLAVSDHNNAKNYDVFVKFLVDEYAKGHRVVLIIDEAQNLPPETLEDIRMLSNVNNEKDQLLQIVLVGQPELLETLNKPSLRQFAQRIAVHCHLDPLSAKETAGYIRHRLSVVGGSADLFDDEACAAVHYFTGGVPRLINLLCDQALVYGFSEDIKAMKASLIAEVVIDRSRMGLSPFKKLPEGWRKENISFEMAPILAEIRSPTTDQ